VVNVAPPLFTQPALDAQSRGAKIVWINVPPMPDVKNALFVATDAFGMGQTGGAIIASELEKSLNKPAAEITGDVVGAVEVPGLSVLENRMAGQVNYLKKRMPKINVLPEFDSKPDRERNFALWDQAIRKSPNALVYLDTGEEGEENIPKILAADKIKRPFVSYDTPEEVRDDIAQGMITAAVPANFFSQAYLAVYITAQSLLQNKPLPVGWVKVPHVTVDKSNIDAYQKAWEKPETGLRSFYSAQIEATRENLPATLPDPDLYTHPAQ
jgi:ribose transport system substrate-binding protein